jgi:hypothetical protein
MFFFQFLQYLIYCIRILLKHILILDVFCIIGINLFSSIFDQIL